MMKKYKEISLIIPKRFFQRVVCYTLSLFLLTLIQINLNIFGLFRYSSAGIVLAAVSAIGFFDNEKAGAVCGLIAGITLDLYGKPYVALMPLIGTLVGFFSGYAALEWLPRKTKQWTLVLAATAIIDGIKNTFYCFTSNGEVDVLAVLYRVFFVGTIFTALLGFLSGIAEKWLYEKFVKK